MGRGCAVGILRNPEIGLKGVASIVDRAVERRGRAIAKLPMQGTCPAPVAVADGPSRGQRYLGQPSGRDHRIALGPLITERIRRTIGAVPRCKRRNAVVTV